ncbi:uncharacterized protein B0T23DRAFT_307833, partial [Neurospora hispaniola]
YCVFAAGYINNIIIFNNIVKDHFKHLEIIFKLFKNINLNITPKKLFITYPFIRLLNYCMDSLSIATITDCIVAIRNI